MAFHLATSVSANRLFKFLRTHEHALLSQNTETAFSWSELLALEERELRKRHIIQPNKSYEGKGALLEQVDLVLRLCEKEHIQLTTYASSDYPDILRKITIPPLILYYKGTLPRFDYERDHTVAIVGTRTSEAFINEFIIELADAIVQHGGHVLSGMAIGVDTAAHCGALRSFMHENSEASTSIPTTAVLASGVDRIYPFSNRKLYENILKHHGCILSEYPPGIEPLGYHFPIRNRIIAGLAREIFMAQSSARSGALITAQYGVDYGRDVYTYSVETIDPLPESYAGNLKLSQDGAHTVRSVEDFLLHTGLQKNGKANPLQSPYETPQALLPERLSEVDDATTLPDPQVTLDLESEVGRTQLEQNILILLKNFPASLQELSKKLGVEVIRLSPILMELTLDSKIREISPNRYMLKK